MLSVVGVEQHMRKLRHFEAPFAQASLSRGYNSTVQALTNDNGAWTGGE